MMMKNQITFKDASNAINNWAKEELQNLGAKFESGIPYFIQLQNFLTKLIKPQPRKVSISQSFIIPDKHKLDFDQLIKKITEGRNLKKHLSRLTNVAYYSDEFLDLYGLHHFHFKKGGSGYLALALVNDNEVFFVEVKQHIDKDEYVWISKSVLEILHKERPDLIKQFKVPCSLKTDDQESFSNQKMKNALNNGYTFPITLDDGTAYIPQKLGRVSYSKPVNLLHKLKFKKQNVLNFKDLKWCKIHKKSNSVASEHFDHLNYCSRTLERDINNYLSNIVKTYNCKIYSVEILDLESKNLKTFNKYKVKVRYELNSVVDEVTSYYDQESL